VSTGSLVQATVLYQRGRVQGDRLTRALLDAAVDGQRPNCSDAGSWMWLSEDPAERREAARRCHRCVVFVQCGEAAEARREAFGVWAGKDYAPRQKKQEQAA
jgi:hypothetical protein